MRYLVSSFFVIFIILTSNSCKQKQENSQLEADNFYLQDSLDSNGFELNDILYAVPSPHQISLQIKDDYPYYEEELFKHKIDINNYSTSERKSLVLGALCADLGYLSLYEQKDLAIEYLNNIQLLVNATKLGQYNTKDLFSRIDNNLGNSDSILMIMSEILIKENESIRTGDRPYLSSLIVAGGWIESFYIINKLYSNSKNSNLFGILLQQQYVLENVIQQLRPYYRKSREYTELVDKLVEIAYEYEVVDVVYKNIPAENSDSSTHIKCRFTQVLTGSQLENMYDFSNSLRKSLIY